MSYHRFYNSSSYYGSDKIIMKYLDLHYNYKLPLVIPHGIDFFQHEKYLLDFNCLEPIYICLRDDIFKTVKKTSRVPLKFPHPWLFLIKQNKIKKGEGTLFIAPPCSIEQYQNFFNSLNLKKFKKPWRVMIKHRGVNKKDFLWWKNKGINPLTAGEMKNPHFYEKLFKILNNSNEIILCNMSSAGIFAAALGKKVGFIKNFYLTDLETNEVKYPKYKNKNYTKVKKTWKKILSVNKIVSKKTAYFLLGAKYFKKKKLMKKELLIAIKLAENNPIYSVISSKYLNKLILKLTDYNENFIKLFPNPIKKIRDKIINLFGLSTLSLNTINDFGYYKLGGKFSYPMSKKIYINKLENPEPGHVPKEKKKYKNLFNF